MQVRKILKRNPTKEKTFTNRPIQDKLTQKCQIERERERERERSVKELVWLVGWFQMFFFDNTISRDS